MFLAAVETVLDVLPKPGPRKLEREFLPLSPVGVTLYLQLGDALSLQPTLLAWLVHEQIYQQ